ncbi:one cut domain family member 3 [Lontra canadensis]|uniref:one cut domain family member 3 n=1 Tax=Lontra canadensis TaxID=76717 RepID=UPI0013F3730B|nr:one cut domain family member 3 [Lontra canadensis]
MELSLESLGGLHGVAHAQAGELLSPGHARSAAAQHRGLVAPGRPGLVAGMASLLDGGGGGGGSGGAGGTGGASGGADFRGELAGPLHPAMGMACEAPGLGGTYTTLTPLQHLPPLAAVADKFHQHAAAAAVAGAHGGHPHAHPHPAAAPPPPPPPQRLAASVSGSFTLMRDERAALASVGHLYGPYGKELPAMGSPLSPLPNALPPALHGAPQPPPPPPPPLAAYGAPSHLAGDKLLPPAAFEPHAALLGRAEDALARGLPGGGGGGGGGGAGGGGTLPEESPDRAPGAGAEEARARPALSPRPQRALLCSSASAIDSPLPRSGRWQRSPENGRGRGGPGDPRLRSPEAFTPQPAALRADNSWVHTCPQRGRLARPPLPDACGVQESPCHRPHNGPDLEGGVSPWPQGEGAVAAPAVGTIGLALWPDRLLLCAQGQEELECCLSNRAPPKPVQATGSSMRPQLGPLEHLSRGPLVTARLHSRMLGVEKGSHPTTVTGEPEPRFSERQAHPRARAGGSVGASISPTRRAPPGIAVETGHGDPEDSQAVPDGSGPAPDHLPGNTWARDPSSEGGETCQSLDKRTNAAGQLSLAAHPALGSRGKSGSGLSPGACKRKEQEQQKERALQPKKQRLVFTDLQRRTLIAIFKENKRPSKEMQVTISQQLGLELNTVSNFFMNARRRCVNRWAEEPGAAPAGPAAAATFSKA